MRLLGFLFTVALLALLSAACSKGHGGTSSNYVYTTPTPPPAAAVLDQAAPLCDAAFQRSAHASGVTQGPVFDLEELDESQLDPSTFHDTNLNRWRADSLPALNGIPAELTAPPDAAHALVCLRRLQVQVGSFQISGSAAVRLDDDVRLLSWPDGALVAAQAFQGPDPPSDRTISAACRANSDGNGCKDPVYGRPPASDLSAWLKQQLGAAP